MDVVDELAKYLGLPTTQVFDIMKMRENLLQAEHLIYDKAFDLPESENPIEFYQDSRLMMFSNAMDEIERDGDTDWQDMRDDLPLSHYPTVLDFGAGIGSAGFAVAEMADSIYFYEPNHYSRQFLNWRIWRRIINGKVLEDIDSIPTSSLDLIIAWGVFEHLDDKTAAQVFNSLLPLLTKDGHFFLKNFYEQTDEYLLHFEKGSEIQKLYEKHADKIVYARHSH